VAGEAAEKHSFCEAATKKDGRTGPLGLVTLRHDIHQSGHLCVTEWQDLVYRAEPDPEAPSPAPPAAPAGEQVRVRHDFTTTLLFRYSALTFNGHRIHYDQPYARQVEGYQGLVVHGPLLAQLLLLMAEDQLGPLSAFDFRATAPLMDHETAEFCRKGNALWVRGPEGRQCMTATAVPRSE
jgi:3-methylfumaryl-CoA hydratase